MTFTQRPLIECLNESPVECLGDLIAESVRHLYVAADHTGHALRWPGGR
jgi:hypothetical protein